MKFLITLSLALLTLAVPAHKSLAADTTPVPTMPVCAIIEDRGERLQCFDTIAVSQNLMTAEKAAKQKQIMNQVGLWRVQTQTDETGRDVTYLKLAANEPVTLINGIQKTPELILSCREKTTDVYIDWKVPLQRPGNSIKSIFVKTRMDEDITVAKDWNLSFDKKAAFMPDTVAYVRAMKTAHKLSLELTPVNESATVVLFTLNGFEAALNTLVQRCYN